MFRSIANILDQRSSVFYGERLVFIGLVLLVFGIPFERFETQFRLLGFINITNLVALMMLVLGLWAGNLLINRRWPTGWPTKFSIPLGLLLLVALLASLVDPLDSTAAIKGFFRLLLGVAVFGMVVDLATTPSRIQLLVAALAILGCIIAILGILDWYRLPSVVTFLNQFQRQNSGNRLIVFNSVSTTALSLAMTGCISLGLMGSAFRQRNRQFTILWSLSSILIGTALLLTMSRGGLLAFAIAVASIFIFGKHSSIWRWLVIISMVLILGVVTVQREANTFGRPEYSSGLSGRQYLWSAALQLGFENPWLGIGPNNFRLVERERVKVPSDFPGIGGQTGPTAPIGVSAHNLYLQFFADLGWPGLLILIWIVFISLGTIWRLLRQSPFAWQNGIATALIVWWVQSLLETFVWVTGGSLLFWLTFGVAVATEHKMIDQPTAKTH